MPRDPVAVCPPTLSTYSMKGVGMAGWQGATPRPPGTIDAVLLDPAGWTPPTSPSPVEAERPRSTRPNEREVGLPTTNHRIRPKRQDPRPPLASADIPCAAAAPSGDPLWVTPSGRWRRPPTGPSIPSPLLPGKLPSQGMLDPNPFLPPEVGPSMPSSPLSPPPSSILCICSSPLNLTSPISVCGV